MWLGGGFYYVLALRPQVKQGDEQAREVARQAQRAFGEWAALATLILIVSGLILTFDQLNNGKGTPTYVLLLIGKIAAAVIAFSLAGSFSRRRVRPVRRTAQSSVTGQPAAPKGHRLIERSWLILMLGSAAFMVGIVLSSLYPTGIGQR